MDDTSCCMKLILVVVVGSIALSAVGMTAAAGNASGNQTTSTATAATPTATPIATQTATPGSKSSAQECEEMPNLEQARLYAPQRTVTAGSPGRITGGFQLDPASTCAAVVSITMSVPSGMAIEGGADYFSSGAGLTTAEFELMPDQGVKDLRANVYAESTGTYRVTADIKYWPKGNPHAAREIDSLTFTFRVEEPATPPADAATGNTGNGLPISTPVAISFGLIAAIIVGFISMTKLTPRDINLGIRK